MKNRKFIKTNDSFGTNLKVKRKKIHSKYKHVDIDTFILNEKNFKQKPKRKQHKVTLEERLDYYTMKNNYIP